MSSLAHNAAPAPVGGYRRELHAYLRGFLFAALLSAVPFAMEGSGRFARVPLLWVIGVLGLTQILVHVRYFLHVDFSRERREELALLLFSAALLVLMIAGMLWILYNMYMRMM